MPYCQCTGDCKAVMSVGCLPNSAELFADFWHTQRLLDLLMAIVCPGVWLPMHNSYEVAILFCPFQPERTQVASLTIQLGANFHIHAAALVSMIDLLDSGLILPL